MPNPSAEHSEVIDFAGGVIRILRHDWSGALQLFEKVVENPRTPLAVLVECLSLFGYSGRQNGAKLFYMDKEGLRRKSIFENSCSVPLHKPNVGFQSLKRTRDQRGERGLELLHSLDGIASGGHHCSPSTILG